mmetsp:Transcript_2104/g.4662  ORF Transcript_2104/g.4662 Transcript_2104/m.4662 type:complete len:607 (-) Transcript_2104:264-2084(-)
MSMNGNNNYGSVTTAATIDQQQYQQQAVPPSAGHMSTYTAGEDAGRLATIAKEFGLSRTRAPRDQVRARVSDELGTLNLETLKLWAGRLISLDESYLEMRYTSVYSAHMHADDLAESSESDTEIIGLLMERLPSVGEDEDEDEEQKHLQIEGGLDEKQAAAAAVDPHATGLGGKLSSATLGIIKGMVGPAILYLPHGFASAGYLMAIPVMMLTTALFLWSSKCLLESWKVESDRVNGDGRRRSNSDRKKHRRKRIVLSYPELAYRAFGSSGERLVQVGISLMQSGVCLTYLIFVPQNLRSSAALLLGWDISTNWTLALMVAVQVPLSWIRDIRRLTVTNLLANALILYGLVTCLVFAVDEVGAKDGDDATSEPFLREVAIRARSLPAFNPSGWFLFLGTSVLLFEGSITLLVPLQEAVHASADRERFPCLYSRVILGIVSFYAFFGISCWMVFGDEVRTVMTTSLPLGRLATSVQLAYSLAVVFTFPLQNFPSLEIVCVMVERMLPSTGKVDGGSSNSAYRSITSTLLIFLLSTIAIVAMNDLDKVVSLMGSLLGCPLAFVIPPLIQNQLEKGQISETKRRVNIMVAVLGVGAMVVSSITTLLKWE